MSWVLSWAEQWKDLMEQRQVVVLDLFGRRTCGQTSWAVVETPTDWRRRDSEQMVVQLPAGGRAQ
jgi:hypothetical protein